MIQAVGLRSDRITMGEVSDYDHSSNIKSPCARSSDKPLSITTSVRSDPRLCDITGASRFSLIPYHQARMLDAARFFGWQEAERTVQGADGFLNLTTAIEEQWVKDLEKGEISASKCYKIRLLMNCKGSFTISATELPGVSIDNLFPKRISDLDQSSQTIVWKVFISPIETVPTAFTRHKTTHREVYDKVRKHIPASVLDGKNSVHGEAMPEILLVNTQGEIMEGSITTPYFFRYERWVTPPESSGGNIGTTRRWALEKELCIEEIVQARDVKPGELIWLSNGARGWGLGIIANR